MAHGMEAIDEEPGPLKKLWAPVEHVLGFLAVEIVDDHELIQDRLWHSLIEDLEEVLPALWSHHAVPAIAHCMQAAAYKEASCVFLGGITPDLLLEAKELRLHRISHRIIPFSHCIGLGSRINPLKPGEHTKPRKAPFHARLDKRKLWDSVFHLRVGEASGERKRCLLHLEHAGFELLNPSLRIGIGFVLERSRRGVIGDGGGDVGYWRRRSRRERSIGICFRNQSNYLHQKIQNLLWHSAIRDMDQSCG